jgi:tetratricopeptide (TPR) repeat protein
LKRAHALKPYSAPILYTLCQLPAESVDVDLLQALGHVRRQEGQSQEEFDTRLAFARAAALDKLGRYEEAWEALLQANRREFPRHADACRRHRARMQAVRKAAEQEPARYANEGAELQPLSVFIIGPSRSGKTTLEHLAAEMKGVRRGFERRLIEPASQRASQLAGLPTISDPIELPKTLDARFREFYREELEEFAAGAGIVTDTHPAMIASVGRVAAAIPKVRFIFVKRDMFDVALRIFMKPYRTGNPYAYDIGTIFVHLSWYYDMIDLWCERFPDIAFSVDYEEMISQPGATSRRIADLCGVLAPESPLPDLGDDRNCSAPYRSFIQAELSRSRA